MIEQFMLTANEAVATLLTEKHVPCVYRVHESPPEDKVCELLTYAKNLGLDIRGIKADRVTSNELSRLLSDAERRGVKSPVSYTMLRSLSKAHYSENLGLHFGLAIEKYCHFPTRFYPVFSLIREDDETVEADMELVRELAAEYFA